MNKYMKIAKELKDNTENNSILNLECMDREETIKAFNEFFEKSDKIIY